ncbi:hypothetical protein HanRHA438_Chr14g0635171 [Helianthus annuus]|nr:hypothetical protein HanHA89_Chr14g0543791 [Helianthus annuus]KAJ0654963.1 hypothetical protein HanLR1_Chr14g0513051 [Helianthus annuus]KAJ0852179.1 hypothetical protein HanRHA438_Chr14g0635171 [Helianthus annuus]
MDCTSSIILLGIHKFDFDIAGKQGYFSRDYGVYQWNAHQMFDESPRRTMGYNSYILNVNAIQKKYKFRFFSFFYI